MLKIHWLYISVWILIVLQESRLVSAQRFTIQPSTIYVSSGSMTSTATPEVVVMECTADGIGLPVNTIFSMYIKRDSASFAEVVFGQSPKISPNAPNDIRTKNPTLDGSINSNNPLSSRLQVTFQVSRMSCVDEATYQCFVLYKPQNSDSAETSTNTNLNVNVLPRDLQISAGRTQVGILTPIQNLTIINRGEQVEFSCTGYIGDSQTTVIEWFRKVSPNMFFQRFYPTQAGDSIDDGFPSSSSCEYMRTSKLRFSFSSTDTARMAFRCEVGTTQTAGSPYRVYSQEFHITPEYSSISGTATLFKWSPFAVLVFTVLTINIVQ